MANLLTKEALTTPARSLPHVRMKSLRQERFGAPARHLPSVHGGQDAPAAGSRGEWISGSSPANGNEQPVRVPHPIPYQGSKRKLAAQISAFFPRDIRTLIEPFAGSAALTLAAAARGLARRFLINDLNPALMELWRMILERPRDLARQYEAIWNAQHGDRRRFYDRIRDEFNRTQRPSHLLFLLARCVKAAVRYNAKGQFNQSPDNRRTGVLPETMREHLLGASLLLKDKTELSAQDYRTAMAQARVGDLVYLDPPYQGVCGERDARYLKGVLFEELVEALEVLNTREISYIVTYDGRTGGKVHGRPLPRDLQLRHIELVAGRSSQETLLGRAALTYESIYLSPALAKRLGPARSQTACLACLDIFARPRNRASSPS